MLNGSFFLPSLNGSVFLRLIVDKLPEFDVAERELANGYCHKVFSIRAEAGLCNTTTIMDDEFFLQMAVVKLPDFDGAIDKGCHKVFSIGAEASTHHPYTMPEGDFFPPLTALKLPEFGGIIVIRDCHKVFFIGAEVFI